MFITDTSVSSVTVQLLSSYIINDDVSVVCTINFTNPIGPNISSLVVNWFKNNEMITDNITINGSLSTFDSILTLTQVSSTDAGVYTCNASITGSDEVMTDSKNLYFNATHLCAKGLIHENLLLFDISYLSVNDSFIADTHFYSNLRLGDIIKHDCTPGYRQSGVTVQWRAPDNSLIMNPLIITVNQSISNTLYTCVITINNHDASYCPLYLANEVFISVKGNVILMVDLMFIHS